MEECTFETKCWENDYKLMLNTNHIEKVIRNCNYNFKKRQVIINNVKDETIVCKLAQNLKDRGVIDEYYVSSQYADEAIRTFDVADKFKGDIIIPYLKLLAF